MEIDILGHSCDVVKLGNLLKIALIYFPSRVVQGLQAATAARLVRFGYDVFYLDCSRVVPRR